MFKSFFSHTRKPGQSLSGRIMLQMMNKGHQKTSLWAISHIDFTDIHRILDIGCGGGRNIANMLQFKPSARIYGVDYSNASVEGSKKYNQEAINAGRVHIQEGNVMDLPFPSEDFDLATAFETIYFWPDLFQSFQEVHRVLKDGGVFMIYNDMIDPVAGEKWTKIIDHMKIYTLYEIEDCLKASGFQDIQIIKAPKSYRGLLLAKK